MGQDNPLTGAPPWLTHYAHPCAWDQSFAPLSLPDMFAQSAAAAPLQPLVEFYGRDYSYAALHTEARAFAGGLQRLGVAKGDRVGLFLPNVPIYVAAYYGALIAGAVLVNFSPLYTPDELAAQVADSGTKLLVTINSAALLPNALKVLERSGLERLVVGRLAAMLPFAKGLALRLFKRAQLTPLPPDARVLAWDTVLTRAAPTPVPIDPLTDLALIQYTGGTTGSPKGAMLTHQNLSANARQIDAIDPFRGQRDVMVGVLPLFHVFANSVALNRTVINRGCIAMLPRFEAGQALALIARVRATAMPGVPTMYQALLDHPRMAATDFTSLRACISGGAPLTAQVKARFEAASHAKLVEGYGLTEAAGVVSTNPYAGDDHPGSIGQPLPGTRLALVDKLDPNADPAPGEPGELVIAGPQVMAGYWRRPDAEASAFVMRGGTRWLRTGDVAVIDADGFVRIVDRVKDMISVGGFKVYPSRIEAALMTYPAVKEVLVIGVPDPYLGERPRAYLTLREDADRPLPDAETLAGWLNAGLGKHERVDSVVIRDALPKTMIGKLDRKALRAEVGEG